MCIWKINTPHNAFIMTQYACVSPIYLNMQAMFGIYCHVMCATALFSDGRLLHIVWDVIRIHSMFFPSVMVQLRWINWGRVTFLFSLGFVCLWIHSSHAHHWLFACLPQIVSHNAAQRQRTEVIFLWFLIYFYLRKILELKTLTTEPREKTDHTMRGGRLIILLCVCVCWWLGLVWGGTDMKA